MKRTTVGGVELAMVDRGAGLPVVLVHGFPLDHTMWNAQIEALSRAYRVIAPDLRGFGRSGVTEGTVGMRHFADDLAALLDALAVDVPVVICGLSMGGYIVFQFWRAYAWRVRGLVLCDTRAAADTPQMAAGRRQMADRVLREGPGPLVEMMMPRLFREATLAEQPQIVESVRRLAAAAEPRGIAAAARGMAERPDVTGWLGEIQCPTLVIVGQHDVISPPEEMRSIAEAIPHARLVEIAGAGHMAPLERPAEVNRAILEFLGRLG